MGFMRTFFCFGGVWVDEKYFVDSFEDARPSEVVRVLGGSALNTAASLATLGCDVTLGGNVLGFDAEADFIQQKLLKLGVKTDLEQTTQSQTPIFHIPIRKNDAQRDFIRTKREPIYNLQKSYLGDFDFCYINTSSDCGRHLAFSFAKTHWVLVQDVEPDDELVGAVDAVQISMPSETSLEDLKKLCGLYAKQKTKLVLVTLGARGALVFSDGALIYQETVRPNVVVDTTGCGDSFRAGFLKGLSTNKGLETSLQMGMQAGTRVATYIESYLIPDYVT